MEQFKRIGVFLNQEPGDREAVRYAGLIARAAGASTLNFVVVRGMEDSPAGPAQDADEIRNQIIGAIEDVQNHNIEVSDATGLYEILRCARDPDLDLIIVGRRLPSDQLAVGSVFYRLSRKAPCSVLVVPEHSRPHLARLLVMVDGSARARLALETAVVIARGCGESNPQILVQSTFHVGYGYRSTGVSMEEAAETMKKNTASILDNQLAGVDVSGLTVEKVVASSDTPEVAALSLASAHNMDCIVLGSHGMTKPAAVLLGATTERILVRAPLPVLIVKKKGETLRLLDALLFRD